MEFCDAFQVAPQVENPSSASDAVKTPNGGQLHTEIAELAHDFNNLLSIIGGNARLLVDVLDEQDEKRESAQAIVTAANQGAGLIRRLLVRGPVALNQKASCVLGETVQAVVKTIATILPESVSIRTQCRDSSSLVAASPEDVHRILTNLVLNAGEAMPAGGHILVVTRFVHIDAADGKGCPALIPGPYGLVTVSDNGPGMSAEVAGRIFEPFFTTKGTAGSRGLGLAIVFGLVKEVDGYVSLETAAGKGSKFRIYLPIALPKPFHPY